jgi:hypothetical protein
MITLFREKVYHDWMIHMDESLGVVKALGRRTVALKYGTLPFAENQLVLDISETAQSVYGPSGAKRVEFLKSHRKQIHTIGFRFDCVDHVCSIDEACHLLWDLVIEHIDYQEETGKYLHSAAGAEGYFFGVTPEWLADINRANLWKGLHP